MVSKYTVINFLKNKCHNTKLFIIIIVCYCHWWIFFSRVEKALWLNHRMENGIIRKHMILISPFAPVLFVSQAVGLFFYIILVQSATWFALRFPFGCWLRSNSKCFIIICVKRSVEIFSERPLKMMLEPNSIIFWTYPGLTVILKQIINVMKTPVH